MARAAKATIKRYAIFVKLNSKYRRRNYDIVEYNWGNGEIHTYIQPNGPRRDATGRFTSSYQFEDYDEVRIYDKPPEWDLERNSA